MLQVTLEEELVDLEVMLTQPPELEEMEVRDLSLLLSYKTFISNIIRYKIIVNT
jgi:hypothetical protein